MMKSIWNGGGGGLLTNRIPITTNWIVSRSIQSSSFKALAQYKYKTYPGSSSDKIDLSQFFSQSFNAKSVFIATTPDLLHVAEEKANEINDKDDSVQLIIAAFDTVGKNSIRSGISTLWCDELINIMNVDLAQDDDDDASNNNNWRHSQGKLTMTIFGNDGDSYNAVLKLANTLFTNNTFESLYVFEPGNSAKWVKATNISIEIPPAFANYKIHHKSSLIPLPFNEKLSITDCKHNMIKAINGKPASSILQDNQHLMSVVTKETRVFAKITKDGMTRRYEVVGGGGSWGPKARLLALNPEPQMFLPLNSTVEFLYLDEVNKFQSIHEKDDDAVAVFECSLEDDGERQLYDTTLIDCFGIGSEKGFSMNGVNYNSSGESISLIPH